MVPFGKACVTCKTCAGIRFFNKEEASLCESLMVRIGATARETCETRSIAAVFDGNCGTIDDFKDQQCEIGYSFIQTGSCCFQLVAKVCIQTG